MQTSLQKEARQEESQNKGPQTRLSGKERIEAYRYMVLDKNTKCVKGKKLQITTQELRSRLAERFKKPNLSDQTVRRVLADSSIVPAYGVDRVNGRADRIEGKLGEQFIKLDQQRRQLQYRVLKLEDAVASLQAQLNNGHK